MKKQKRYFTQITEHCGYEGESWSFFIPNEGNEPFLEKLKATIKKFKKLSLSDAYLEIEDEEVPENEVKILVKRTDSGYMDYYNKIDKIIDPKAINDSDEDAFVDSFYKAKLFEG